MVKFVRRGGIWKNSEDEILKAAIMKYGKNQWARISSLLPRKTPKECKARWYDWLDPNIRKTSWTREEDEKLLHLAKTMPCQWRTIAPLVGRTSAQCLERYSSLLEGAQSTSSSAGALSEVYRLDGSEISASSRPARPDAVDMEEDEKEMISEARARLANTKGKKAKRKAREKQLEEARRLASLQKRRELKAAGIEVSRRKKFVRPGDMDYNAEIPFEKPAPKGFFDTTEEDHIAKKMKIDEKSFKPVSVEDLEGKRKDILELEQRKKDRAKQNLKKEHDLPGFIKHLQSLRKTQSERPKLSLPSPQLSIDEMEDLQKLNKEASKYTQSSGNPSDTLLRNSISVATPTPMRTPRNLQADEYLRKQAQNLIALTQSQTPLMQTPKSEDFSFDDDVSRPSEWVQRTPNPLKTPASQNSKDPLPLSSKKSLLNALSNLPAPRNAYEPVQPLSIEKVKEGTSKLKLRSNEEHLQLKQCKSSALNQFIKSSAATMDLPRPVLDNSRARYPVCGISEKPNTIEGLVEKEVLSLIKMDHLNSPLCWPTNNLDGVEKDLNTIVQYEDLSEDEISHARRLVALEMGEIPDDLIERLVHSYNLSR